MSIKEDILEKVRAVPSIPTSAVQVVELANNPDANIPELRRLVELDPGLTANVLRLANSAYFGGVGTIDSIQEAIVRLGMKRVFHLALSSAVAPLEQPPIRGYDLPPGGLLRHCVCTAIAAEELGHVLELDPPEQTFTAGLLHDVGKIVLGTFLEVDAQPIMKLAYEEEVSFEEAERRILGTDHPEVGALLLQEWNIPAGMVQVVRWHHEPERFEGDNRLVLDLVHIADELARMIGAGTGLDGLNYTISEDVLKRLKVTTRTAEDVVSKVVTDLEELGALFAETAGEGRHGP